MMNDGLGDQIVEAPAVAALGRCVVDLKQGFGFRRLTG